jgi:hypothetical protein
MKIQSMTSKHAPTCVSWPPNNWSMLSQSHEAFDDSIIFSSYFTSKFADLLTYVSVESWYFHGVPLSVEVYNESHIKTCE